MKEKDCLCTYQMRRDQQLHSPFDEVISLMFYFFILWKRNFSAKNICPLNFSTFLNRLLIPTISLGLKNCHVSVILFLLYKGITIGRSRIPQYFIAFFPKSKQIVIPFPTVQRGLGWSSQTLWLNKQKTLPGIVYYISNWTKSTFSSTTHQFVMIYFHTIQWLGRHVLFLHV